MRALRAAACILLAMTGEAMGQPQSVAVQEVSSNARNTAQQTDGDEIVALYRTESRFQSDIAGSSGRVISLGPFRFRIENQEVTRPTLVGTAKRAQTAHVQLEDVHLFGGNISGAYDGRAATLRLSWPTSN